MASLLTKAEIQDRFDQLRGWELQDKALRCQRIFPGFVEAIEFVNQLVQPAEEMGHHPDLAIAYNKVQVTLTTHDAGGLTAKDFELAQIISQI